MSIKVKQFRGGGRRCGMSATHATDWIVVDNTSDGRPLVFHSDREALSTARFRRAGSLATADGSWTRHCGTGLCSYRVRGVGGSCAEHLTVESYTIIISLQSYLLSYYTDWYSITHSLFHSRLKSFLSCKSSLPHPFLFPI